MRKILFVTYQDYANVSTDIAKSINEHQPDWDARVCSCVPHPFGYPTAHDLDYDVDSEGEKVALSEWIRSGIDVLVWAEEARNPSDYYSFHAEGQDFANAMLFGALGEGLDQARCYVFHAGNGYRGWSERYNYLDKSVFAGQIVSPDLWRLTGGSGLVCFGKPMDADPALLMERRDVSGGLVVCHSPTNYELKGTWLINMAMKMIVKDFPRVTYRQIGGPVHKDQHLSYGDLRSERRKCHIYIDQFSSIGGIGMSALEAMSDGLITLCTTHMIQPNITWGTSSSREGCPIVSLPCPTGDIGIDVEVLYNKIAHVCRGIGGELDRGLSSAVWVHRNLDPESFSGNFMEMLWPG